MRNKELEDEQAQAFLTTIALIPHPSPPIINSINVLMQVSELQSKALLSGSALIYQLCQKSHTSCSELPEVQTFMQTLKEMLKENPEGEQHTQDKLFYVLKSVGNTGMNAPDLIPLINRIMLSRLTTLELRLVAIQAFRRFPCSADRSLLLQLYHSSQEDPEVRIAAYQQLLRCPDQNLFEVVKMTLRNETSSQVGSYVWSHLTNVLRSEDPMKQALIELLPDDIISRDFEAEFMKYSSYSDSTFSSGMGVTNVETSLVFSSKSFLPRSASANLTVYFHGRAHNILEVDLHVENAEPILKNMFGYHDSDGESQPQSQTQSREAMRTRRKTDDRRGGEKETCLSSSSSYLEQARAMLFGRRRAEKNRLKCWLGVKVFGNELSVFTCEDLYNQMNQLSLNAAGLVVKLLKGQEVQLNHRAVLMTEELILPSLSGLPVKLGINMTSILSLRLKGNINYRDVSHFSLSGYIKPDAHVGLSVRMGVDGALGQAAVDWVSELRSSTSMDGSIQLQEGRDLRVTLNTPEDIMDIISISSRVFQLSGDHREEIKGPKSRVQKTTCTPKTWSKMVGWQLCSNASYPFPATGVPLPPPGPLHFSLRMLKLDRGLHYYLLEAAYSLFPQRGTWLPREASLHLLLATPQSSIPRDMSLDLTFNPRRLLLRMTHPLKTIVIQGLS
ncbi:apolipophorins-like [Cheilinus undulatus]|uniref:apolipophorins-like n=1 Tax=Cheilinus undulatus TaxID=241271 RepID=UPI001BD5A8C2|nr:apolipophorins-like [Cheilinus undulatus]